MTVESDIARINAAGWTVMIYQMKTGTWTCGAHHTGGAGTEMGTGATMEGAIHAVFLDITTVPRRPDGKRCETEVNFAGRLLKPEAASKVRVARMLEESGL